MRHLIHDLSNIRFRETLRLVSIRHIKVIFLIESNHAIEASTIQK